MIYIRIYKHNKHMYMYMYMHKHMHMYMHEAIVLDNWQLAELPQSEFDPTGVASVWVRSPPGPRKFIDSFVGLYGFPYARPSKLNQHICISPAPGRNSKLTQVLKLTPVHSRRVVSCPVQPRVCHWNCVFDTISVAWSDRAGQLAAGRVASVWRLWVRSPPGQR